MRPLDHRMLRLLARMPFLDRLEAAMVGGWSRGAAYESFRRLKGSGLLGSLPHATDLIPLTRRFHLTESGVRMLARADGMELDHMLRHRPVSNRGRRVLLDRLDGLSVIYRTVSAVAGVAHPVCFRWYRGMPMDAAMSLPGGRTVGILRLGPTSDRAGFAKRMWRLAQLPPPGTLLMLMPDEVRLRHARRLLARIRVPALFALESDAASGAADNPIWRLASVDGAVELGDAVDRLPAGGVIFGERPLARFSLPRALDRFDPTEDAPEDLLPALLRPAEKRAIDLMCDWPWLQLRDLAGLMGVSRPRASQVVGSLEGFGLAVRTSRSGGRLALSDAGVAMLARRDRASVGIARRRWSPSLINQAEPLHWKNVAGRRSRQLLRHAEHTGAVHGFMATLAAQAVELGWEVVQLDPPIRASRYFQHWGRMRSIHPDAFGLLRRDGVDWPFFLEWERRAVRPAAMRARLAPYLRYYSTRRPIDDHGSPPRILVVFNLESAATGFLRVARKEMEDTGTFFPLLVSHRKLVARMGSLGRAWYLPGRWEPVSPLPSSSTTNES